MTEPLRSKTSTIDIYIKLAQYPILCDRIRERMRQEIFTRGFVTEEDFEKEVQQKAVESQKREGIFDAFSKEPAHIWKERCDRIRSFHTDFYFAYNLPIQLFEELVYKVLSNQHQETENVPQLSFNPELAPWEMLFRQGEAYEMLPPPEQKAHKHHLEEIKVVLIKGMISDQLPFIGVAKRIFSIEDLRLIYRRRIGTGKIGGKSAGMLLAWKILQQSGNEFGEDLKEQIQIPDSYFLGTDVIYDFRRQNKMDYLMNQKYRALDEIREEYPKIVEQHLAGQFPEKIIDQLAEVINQIGKQPLIVRSSSLLEDNFGSAFAGKYDSFFCPNQGTDEENLAELLIAIKRVYASTLRPSAILYRKKHGLIDYDERMAILLQRVHGAALGRYFFPTLAGVGFSQNPFRWNPKIRREDGFLRLVWGLGTRAVDRVGNDYPRMVSLSHPHLRPETEASKIKRYSQHFIDVVDLEENDLKSLPITDVLTPEYFALRYIASVDKGGYLQPLISSTAPDIDQVVLTFDYLCKDRKFVRLMRTALRRLEEVYETPVDTEFAIEIIPNYPYPDYKLFILQCRPLSQRPDMGPVNIPENIPKDEILFRSHQLIPDGKAEGIRYVVFVDPEMYRMIPSTVEKQEVGRIVGRLNKLFEDEKFILIGPGRWGSSNIELGVRVNYADIYNTKVLIEMAVEREDGHIPELSYGTHFFQDLVEAGIHSLPMHFQHPDSYFDWEFFRESPNLLEQLLPRDSKMSPYIRVVDITAVKNGRRLNILMNGENEEAVGYLVEGFARSEASEASQPPNF